MHYLDKLIKYAYDKNFNISLITNGVLLNKKFIEKNKNYIRMIGISVDSLLEETNIITGRHSEKNIALNKSEYIEKCKYIKDANIKLKINTLVTKKL